MAKSSGNFKKAKAHAEDHNSRKKEPYYLLPSEFRTPNGRGSEFVKFHDARELFDHELAKKTLQKLVAKDLVLRTLFLKLRSIVTRSTLLMTALDCLRS